MRTAWNYVGRAAFWLCWPLLRVYLMFGKRTRVLIVSQDHVVLVKGWLGSGQWLLPGGGLHTGEESVDGALREVREEIGLDLKAGQLEFLQSATGKDSGLVFRYDAFVVQIPDKAELLRQHGELTAVCWASIDSIINGGAHVNNTTRDILSTWHAKV